MAANHASAIRNSRNALTDTHTDAGDWAGTDANMLAGDKAGLSNARSKVFRIRAFAVGATAAAATTVRNEIRVFLKFSTGPVFTYLFTVPVPIWTPIVNERPPWNSGWIEVDISLPDTTYTLAFNKEVDATNLVVEYEVVDHAS